MDPTVVATTTTVTTIMTRQTAHPTTALTATTPTPMCRPNVGKTRTIAIVWVCYHPNPLVPLLLQGLRLACPLELRRPRPRLQRKASKPKPLEEAVMETMEMLAFANAIPTG